MMESTTLGAQYPVVDLGSAIRSMTMDIIMSFCFGESGCLNALEDKDFRHPVIQFMEESLPLLWVFKHFPVVQRMMLGTPEWASEKMGAKGIVMLKKVGLNLGFPTRLELTYNQKLTEQLFSFLNTLPPKAGKSPATFDALNNPKKIIFYRLLDERGRPIASRQSLFDEAQALFAGGSDTVGTTLSVGMYYVLSNRHVHLRLQRELKTIWPSGRLGDLTGDGLDTRPGWEQLEKLPYLVCLPD